MKGAGYNIWELGYCLHANSVGKMGAPPVAQAGRRTGNFSKRRCMFELHAESPLLRAIH